MNGWPPFISQKIHYSSFVKYRILNSGRVYITAIGGVRRLVTINTFGVDLANQRSN